MEYRPSSLKERKSFYEHEFSIKKVKSFFKGRKLPQVCALDAGSDTGIILNKKLNGVMFYLLFKDLKKKIEKYIPEDLYYDRNIYKNPKEFLNNLNSKGYLKQELIFDVDTDNIKCKCRGKHKVCDKCLDKAYKQTLKMNKTLKKYFKKTRIVYSGKGFHIHVLDKRAYSMDNEERKQFVKKFRKFPIDPWVSTGNISLVRMPYSLNATVSRIVLPLNKFQSKKTIPKFLRN